MNNDPEKKKKGRRRILATACLLIMFLLIAGLVIAAFMHAKTGVILSFLFVLMAVPFVFYAAITFVKHKEEEQ